MIDMNGLCIKKIKEINVIINNNLTKQFKFINKLQLQWI